MRPVFLTLVLFALCACTEPSSPRPVAENFLEAMRVHDYEKAAKYSTRETVKLLQQLRRIQELSMEGHEDAKVPTMGAVKIISEEIHGKTATIYFLEEGVPEEQKITLRKEMIDGEKESEWRVSLKKEELPMPLLPESVEKSL